MKFKYALIVVVLLFTSCKDDDNTPEIDCSLVDCAAQSFSIELINSDGVNLIENGTYAKDEITVRKDGNDLSSIFLASDVIFFYPDGKDGANNYEIRLSDSETATLILNLSRIGSGNECCGPFFNINSALFDGVEQEVVEDDNSLFDKIVVVKA